MQDRKQNAHSGTICKSSTLETTTQMPINRMDNHRGHPPCSDSEADRCTMGKRMDYAMIRMNLKASEPERDKEARHKSKYSMFLKTKYEIRQNRSEVSSEDDGSLRSCPWVSLWVQIIGVYFACENSLSTICLM